MYTLPDIRNVHFEPSSLCNARCPVCPRYLNGGVKNDNLIENAVSYEQFIEWFPSEFLSSIKRFQMCGNYGDPGTAPDLVEITKYITDNNCQVVIHTNGGMRKPEFWDALGSINNVIVVFAIDGLEDTNHLYRRGVDWHKLIDNVKAFISAGGVAQWSLLEFQHNEHQIEACRQLSIDMGFTMFHSKRPFGFRENHKDGVDSMLVLSKDGDYDYELYPVGTTEFNTGIPNYVISKENSVIPTRGKWEESVCNNELSCHAINTQEIYISSKGQVHPCCFLSGFPDSPYANWQQYQYSELIKSHYDLLNLNNNSLDKILMNTFFQTKMVQGMKPGPDRIIGCSVFCTKR